MSSMKPKYLVLSLAIISAAVLLFVSLTNVSDSETNALERPRDRIPEERVAPDSLSHTKKPISRTYFLPQSDLPLMKSIGSLKDLANKGNAQASCRLAVELITCLSIKDLGDNEHLDKLNAIEDILSQSNSNQSANKLAAQQIAVMNARERCAGITKQEISEATFYLRKAALAGNVEAMTRYAAGESFGPNPDWKIVQGNTFEIWKRESIAFMHQALQNGSPEALQALANAYRTDEGLFNASVVDDDVKGREYYLLYNRVRGIELSIYESNVGDKKLADRVSQMHAKYFKNKVIPADVNQPLKLGPAWTNTNEDGSLIGTCE